jgi:hypothetical protein
VRAGTGSAADAARILAAIVDLASRPSIELTAMPFGDALLPAVQRSGLGNLQALIARGRTDVRAALSAFPSASVFRPPASAIDAKSFAQVVDGGVQTLLVDANFVPTPPHLAFSPASVAKVSVGGRTATMVLPDAALAALLTAYPSDPVLAEHAALGEMAATWLEFPGTPGRGVAIAAPEISATPPAVYAGLVALVTASPWLKPQRASTFVAQVPPPQGQVERLPSHRYLVFAPSYLERLTSAQEALRQFRRAARGPDAVAEQATLASDLMTAEAGTFVAEPTLGLRYIDAVDGQRGTIARTYATVQPPPDGTTFTLASRSGPLPLKFTNGSQYVLHVRIALDSDPAGGLVFSSGGLAEVRSLPPHSTTEIRFQTNAATTGRYLLRVRVLTPGGARIAESQVVVRATAYNLVALVITVGAGLFLAIWWGRGVLQRRKS